MSPITRQKPTAPYGLDSTKRYPVSRYKNFGNIKNRYLREYGPNWYYDWWVGQNDYVNWAEIERLKRITKINTLKDMWELKPSGIAYEDRNDPDEGGIAGYIPMATSWYPTQLADKYLCNGKPGLTFIDPKCAPNNNNFLEFWIHDGRGGQVAYNVMDWDNQFNGSDDNLCYDTITFGQSTSELDGLLSSKQSKPRSQKSPARSYSDGTCTLTYSYKVLEKVPFIAEDKVPGVE